MRTSNKVTRGITIRIAIALVAFLVAFVAFQSGVTVSEKPNVGGANTFTKIYYSLGLFVLGGLDLGVPDSGPWWGQSMMWVAYFACPAIATAAVVEGIGRLMRAQNSRVTGLTDHTVVIGHSKLAELYIHSFTDPDDDSEFDNHSEFDTDPAPEPMADDLLVVYPDADGQFATEFAATDGLHRVSGDVTSKRFAERINLRHASSIRLLSEDDMLNLETSLFLTEELKIDPSDADSDISDIDVHLMDISLKRDVQKHEILHPGVDLFNAHEDAAERLLEDKIGTFFQSTDYSDEVILAGFGRFGQSMLEQLDIQTPGEFRSVVILDHDAELQHRIFKQQVDLDCEYDVETIDGDIRDPEHWDEAKSYLADSTDEPVIVLGADDDALNLQVALWLRDREPDASLFVRTVGVEYLADAMSGENKFEIENVYKHMIESMNADDDRNP